MTQVNYRVDIYFVVTEYTGDAILRMSEIFQTAFVVRLFHPVFVVRSWLFNCHFQKWKDHFDIVDESKRIIDEKMAMSMPEDKITKTTVFVVDKFEGECFYYLQRTQAL